MHKYGKYLSFMVFLVVIIFTLSSCNFIEHLDELSNLKSRLTQDEKINFAENFKISDEREDYDSDVQFANFRALKGGKLKQDYIFRGASPYLDNARTKFVNKFLERGNIKNVISLSEDEKGINAHISQNVDTENMYFAKKLKNNEIHDDPLNYCTGTINLKDKNDINKLISSFNNIAKSDGNIFIHCAIGRDRTGIYCEILECLADASYKEIVDDYMESFKNYSFITMEDTPEQYKSQKSRGVDATLHFITNTNSSQDLSEINLKEATISFLYQNGMAYNDIDSLVNKICIN